MALLSVEEALARMLGDAAALASESVSVMEAAGRVLASPLAARLTQPPFDASAMDGYAVRAADVARLPARLDVVGEAAAGRGYGGTVGAGEAARIFTGAPLPRGADAIVIQENTTREGACVIVRDGIPDPGHVRRRGFDFSQGDALLPAGVRLDARRLTLAAAMGHGAIPVVRRPIVAILATGDELVTPGTAPGPDQIVCSNTYGIAAMVAAAGATPRLLGIARDTRADLDAHLAASSGADVLVTIGGASVGDHDLVAPALRDMGVEIDFWKIAMRPGKPLMFGRRGNLRALGLPGNPVSSLICGRVFLVPLIRRLLGIDAADPEQRSARLSHDLEANGPRQHYMRAVLGSPDGSPPLVRVVRSQDSSLLAPLNEANVLLVREPHAPALKAGAEVLVIGLDF